MIRHRKLLAASVLIAASAFLLAGCGNSDSRHEVHHAASPSSSKVDNHAPKDASTSDGGTKTTNTHTPDLYAHPKKNQLDDTHIEKEQAPTVHAAKEQVAKPQSKNAPTPSAKSVAKTASHASDSHSSNDGIPTVDLGDGVVGHEDRGAGQVYITFSMGNWNIEVHGNDINSTETATRQAAKNLDGYLQEHALPVPHDHGSLQLDAASGQSTARWQEGSNVDSIDGKINTVLSRICE